MARQLWNTAWRLVVMLVCVTLLALLLLALGAARGAPRPGAALHTIRASDPGFERALSLVTRTQIEPGNRVSLLLNGDETFPAIWSDLRAARRSIMVQQYFSLPGTLMDTLAAILGERARAGVRVRVLLDGHGSLAVSDAWREGLRANGVQLVTLRPLTWRTLYRSGNRSHVRIVAVDDRAAYTGGFGFGDAWLGAGRSRGHWRETNVRVEGPAAAQLRALFETAWFEATGTLAPDSFPPAPTPAIPQAPPGVRAGVFFSAASSGTTPADALLALSLDGATHRITIASSYFVPDAALRARLIAAAKRGVEVRVLSAGRNTDVRLARFAGRYTYGELLRGGVKLYEYQPTMMHAKTIVIDGAWASIGSMNLDGRSIAMNDEANLIVFDETMAARLETVYANDLLFARELTLAGFERRPWTTRVAEWIATLVAPML